jgi:integrase/recombinase XerD
VQAPVEYAVAVDRFLEAARISESSKRVYRISLRTWGWLLVQDGTVPSGAARRGAQAPTVPLGRLDGPAGAARLHAAVEHRALMVDERTAAREVAVLRTAVRWWTRRGWIGPEAQAELRARTRAAIPAGPGPGADLVRTVLDLPAPLREKTLWTLIHESGAPVERLLALDVSDLDLTNRRVRRRAQPRLEDAIGWGPLTAHLLPLLVIGRGAGPVFLTERRAPRHVPAADCCPYTGRARLSARRAAELFQQATAALDPPAPGRSLRDLRPRPASATVQPCRLQPT